MALTYFSESWIDCWLCLLNLSRFWICWFFVLCRRVILYWIRCLAIFSIYYLFSSPSSYDTLLASSLTFCLFLILWYNLLLILAILLRFISSLNCKVRCRLAYFNLSFASYFDNLARAASYLRIIDCCPLRSISFSWFSIFWCKLLIGAAGKKLILLALSLSFLTRFKISFYRLNLTIPTHLSIYCWVVR